MNFKKGDIIQVKIHDLAFGGTGVGKFPMPDGTYLIVFIERTVPGDTVMACLSKIKKNYAEAKLETIEIPSQERMTPRCKHFGICGGCSLQFLNYEQQLQWKAKMVRDALEKIGGFKHIRVEPIIGCENPWFYRNKMEYSFSTDAATGATQLGLHPQKNYQAVFDLEECFLQSPKSVEIALAVEQWVCQKKLTVFSPPQTPEGLRNLIIREGKNTGELMVNLIISGNKFFSEEDFCEWIMKKFPHITSLYCTTVLAQQNKQTMFQEHHLAGKLILTETISVKSPCSDTITTLNFEILPRAFFQTNTTQTQVLYGKILALAQPQKKDTVLDLFCGTGTIGMFFAGLVKSVTGIEINPAAIENARANAINNNITNMEFHSMDVQTFLSRTPLPQNPVPWTILITDPPRSGIAPKTLQKILNLKISSWIYVSCNPTTLSRDLKIICENGFEITKIQPIDMFPQTYHIETLVLLSRDLVK